MTNKRSNEGLIGAFFVEKSLSIDLRYGLQFRGIYQLSLSSDSITLPDFSSWKPDTLLNAIRQLPIGQLDVYKILCLNWHMQQLPIPCTQITRDIVINA